MAYYFEADLDLQGSAQLLNAILEKEANSTGLTAEAQIGYNTTSHRIQYYNGTTVLELASVTGTETLTNKTLTSPVFNTGVSGTAINMSILGSGSGVRAIGSASDTIIPTEKATREAIDASFTTQAAMRYKGALDCSTNPNYPAATVGDTYMVSVAGKVGGASGIVVEAGDFVIASATNAGGTQASVGTSWDVIQVNVDILPTTKGGTGSSIAVVAGDLIYGNGSGTMTRLALGTTGYYLTAGATAPVWAVLPTIPTTFLALTDAPHSYSGSGLYYVRVNTGATALEFAAFPSLYAHWHLRTGASSYDVIDQYDFKITGGTGITVSDGAYSTTGREFTFNLSNMTAYSIKACVSSPSAAPADFAVTTSSVVGRLGSGDIVNIGIGTGASNVAWGNHNHAFNALSDVSATYTSGGDATRGKMVVVNDTANGVVLTSVQMLKVTTINKLLYSSAANTIAEVPYATATTQFLSGSLAGTAPAFRAIALGDLPTVVAGTSPGIMRVYTVLFESAGTAITTKTVTGATHQLGTNITAMLIKSTTSDANWEPVAATVSIVKSSGDVTITTKVACKGLMMIMG